MDTLLLNKNVFANKAIYETKPSYVLIHSMDEIIFNMFIVKEFYILACGDEEVMLGGSVACS